VSRKVLFSDTTTVSAFTGEGTMDPNSYYLHVRGHMSIKSFHLKVLDFEKSNQTRGFHQLNFLILVSLYRAYLHYRIQHNQQISMIIKSFQKF
jgi:hypothetical protein